MDERKERGTSGRAPGQLLLILEAYSSSAKSSEAPIEGNQSGWWKVFVQILKSFLASLPLTSIILLPPGPRKSDAWDCFRHRKVQLFLLPPRYCSRSSFWWFVPVYLRVIRLLCRLSFVVTRSISHGAWRCGTLSASDDFFRLENTVKFDCSLRPLGSQKWVFSWAAFDFVYCWQIPCLY